MPKYVITNGTFHEVGEESLQHHKYIKREKVNGKYRYYYPGDNVDGEDKSGKPSWDDAKKRLNDQIASSPFIKSVNKKHDPFGYAATKIKINANIQSGLDAISDWARQGNWFNKAATSTWKRMGSASSAKALQKIANTAVSRVKFSKKVKSAITRLFGG